MVEYGIVLPRKGRAPAIRVARAGSIPDALRVAAVGQIAAHTAIIITM
jgi:hypothetical protein